MSDSLSSENVLKCSRCGSANVWEFRLDSDWGTGGDYFNVNTQEYKDRPDIQVWQCEDCYFVSGEKPLPLADECPRCEAPAGQPHCESCPDAVETPT